MIIGLTIKNWRSFKNETVFSMVSSGIRSNRQRVPRVNKYRLGILPCAAIYGGNASGKTNLFLALHFMKKFVWRGTQIDARIPVDPFLLDAEAVKQPVEFSIDLLINEKIYEYSFVVTDSHVLEEKLVETLSTKSRTLFHRAEGKCKIAEDINECDRLLFVFEGTRDNQLFLNNSVSQNVETFKPVFDWFKDLRLIGPNQRYDIVGAAKSGSTHFSRIGALLDELDTNIINLKLRDVDADSLNLPADVMKLFTDELKEGEAVNLMRYSRIPAILMRDNGVVKAQKIMSVHQMRDGAERLFEMDQESDGSVRMIDLLPLLLDLVETGSKVVCVIDELDRSLHTTLARKFLLKFFESCSEGSRTQLIFTTHDVNLMDQDLFRKDEIWVAEHNSCGESALIPFSDYSDVRRDKDIRKSYLQGRMGGVPRILETV